MSSVRDETFEVLRAHGLTTVFGNPGSNELHFLAGLPADFRYILGLHEGVVVGMADGYALATGRPAFVNLHAAAGTGNAMGALANAWASHSPLVISAGQQVRATIGVEPLLANTDAAQLPKPLVRFSAEPASASDVPRVMAQAVHAATSHPRGPVYVSIPYDDWAREATGESAHVALRTVSEAASPSAAQVAALVDRFSRAQNPVLVVGEDIDATGANDLAVALAERLRMPAWIAPSASRCPFPTRHPSFRGVLPASVRGISELLAGHDLVIVAGAPVFRYHQYEPGEYLPAGAELVHLTSDADEAARAPMGDALIGDVRAILDSVLATLSEADGRSMPDPRTIAPLAARATDGTSLDPAEVFDVLNECTPDDVIYVKESTSTTSVFWERIDISRPGSYFFPAAGGLGFGMPAAVGVQLAHPDRRVVAIIGDGSANYGITALWSAATYRTPVVFLVLKNGTYGALKSFAGVMGVPDAPGLDLDGIDFCALAEGYGVAARRARSRDELEAALAEALASDGPTLIEIPTSTTNPFE
ncbi:benzoylformate decarboxylase [Microbacterium sp. STN6]|uniref:benzoylformate decarboxylase n=1 Tax=Microbacterium sp. STN6 TaxID=2995588 RepID=UPI002260BD85|nr:benzoylformate decarboxylase [Microbacterium sp. STN6]MCX7523319.1 benzoylformate decarboxylase [Microbacterium sp. STN6]